VTKEDSKNSENFEEEAKPEALLAGDVSGKEEQAEDEKQEIPLVDDMTVKNTKNPGTPETMVEETKETGTELRGETLAEQRLEEKQDGAIEKEEEPSSQKSATARPESTTTADAKKEEEKTPEKPGEEKAKEPEEKTPEKPGKEKAKEPEEKTPEKPEKEKAKKPEESEKKAEKPAKKTKTSKEREKEESKQKIPEPPSLEKIAAEETVAVDKFQKYRKNLETKLFGKYDFSEVVVTDMGLARYINLDPIYIPHSGGKHAKRIFEKAKVNIIERFINKLMRTENYTGKKHTTYQLLRESFLKIEKRTKTNPIQVLIEAIENAAPMEEATRLRFGGISVPKAVDISPSRRLDIALRNIAIGATMARKNRNKHMSDCLADEIIKAAKRDMSCFSIQKKEEKQRYAGSAR